MATSLADIDSQLDALGKVPAELASLVAGYAGTDLSLAHIDEVLSDLESGVELASVPAIETDAASMAQPEPDEDLLVDDRSTAPGGETAVELSAPEPSAEMSVEIDVAEPSAEKSVEIDIAESSGEMSAAPEASPNDGVRDSNFPPRRKRRRQDTMTDSPATMSRSAAAVSMAPASGEVLVDDDEDGEFSDDELDSILSGDEVGDDDVTKVASVEMIAAAVAASKDADADVEEIDDSEVQDADDDEDDFELLIDDDDLELIDDDDLEILDDDLE